VWGYEEFLKAAIGEVADLFAHHDAGANHEPRNSVGAWLSDRSDTTAFNPPAPIAGRFDSEASRTGRRHVIVEGELLRNRASEEHRGLLIIIARVPSTRKPYVLALDEGTSSARAALYNQRGERIAINARPFAPHYPQPGWVEHDALDIWRLQKEAAAEVLEQAGVTASEVAACGITNQRETTVLWDRKTGEPIAPAIVWQCRRTADFCRDLARSSAAAMIEQKTGLVIDAYFSASKIRWLLDHIPDAAAKARDGQLLFGTIDTWLIWKLTGGTVYATDITNASRTLLMNLDTGQWDDELLRAFGVPQEILPSIVPSSGRNGSIGAEHFGEEIPISGVAGDQQAALAGQACFRQGLSKNTYGTGCFAMTHTGNQRPHSRNRLLATAAAHLGATPQFAVEGSVFVAGAAIQWLRDGLQLIGSAAESETIAQSVPDSAGVCMVPAFAGLGAPHWDSAARGIITGLTRATGKAHIVRAALESIAFQSRDLIDAMEADSGENIEELRVDGGASVNNFLMQFQADILGKPVIRPVDVETTALGAAYLAGIAEGVWSGTDEVEHFWQVERRFEPSMPESIRSQMMEKWQDAIRRTRLSLTIVH